MVIPIGYVKSGDWAYVEHDIRTVAMAAAPGLVKVILETAALEPVQIAAACFGSWAAGAGFVKTSTGFHPGGGATTQAVSLMRRAAGTEMGVKASGRDSNGRECHPHAGGWSQPDRHFQYG